jgi:hypothetical protein
MRPDVRAVCYKIRAPKEEMCYISWTIDAYEGVAFMENEGGRAASVYCSSDYAPEVARVLGALVDEGVPIERIGFDETGDL